ncbi:MAG: hypothetical protein FJ303_20950 [Planctomycetes bacterium]|nr:hypothetical protein [Planctomycetota bacterium]
MGKNAIIHPSVMEVLWRCNGCDFRDLAHSPNWSYDMSKERTSETEHVHLFTIDPFDSLGKNGYQTTICEDGKEMAERPNNRKQPRQLNLMPMTNATRTTDGFGRRKRKEKGKKKRERSLGMKKELRPPICLVFSAPLPL